MTEQKLGHKPDNHNPKKYSRLLNYEHQDEGATAALVNKNLATIREGNPEPIGTGVEVEGVLTEKYPVEDEIRALLGEKKRKRMRRGNRLVPVHDGIFVDFERIPAERTTSQLEIVTEPLANGIHPATALDIGKTLGKAMKKGINVGKDRDGIVVFSSASEGGHPSQIRLTDDPKIREAHVRGQTIIHESTPQEALEICKRVDLEDIIPFNGTHVHTSNAELENDLYDARTAYAAGILELTQLSQVESFMLFNTKDFLDERFDDIRDIRSILRRTTGGAHDTTIPDTAAAFMSEAFEALENGTLHALRAHPVRGQHDRVRILTDHGTTESVVGAANPDLRLILTHVYFKQLIRVLSYQALAATGGDESQIIPYLQKHYADGQYAYLFEIIPTMDGEKSCFQQDLRFNKEGFSAKATITSEGQEKSFEEQMRNIRSLVRKIGHDFPTFRTQAKIVNHVLKKITEKPTRIKLSRYLDVASGVKNGIVTDYKSRNLAENQYAQAEGTELQAKLFQQARDDQDLLELFGM